MPETLDVELLADKLRSVVTDAQELDIAQFLFVGLDNIASAYGEGWAAQKERVKTTAHTFLCRRLGPKDMLVSAADGFLIVYVGDDTERANKHAEMLKNELNAFYLGEGATRPAPQVSVRVRRAPAKEVMRTLGQQRVATATDIKPDVGKMPAMDWKFQPVWDGERELVFNYYIAPVLRETGLRVPGYRFDPDPDRHLDLVAVDELSLAESEKALRKMVEFGNRSFLGVAIHSSSMVRLEHRGRIFSVIDRFNSEMLRYRIVQIAATPASFPRMYLEEMFNGLKQRLPRIAVSIAWNEPNVRSVVKLGPAAIGMALSRPTLSGHAGVSLAELFGKIRQAAEIAHSAKIPFYVDADADAQMVTHLRAAGVDIVSSPTVWPLTDEPGGAHIWKSSRLAA